MIFYFSRQIFDGVALFSDHLALLVPEIAPSIVVRQIEPEHFYLRNLKFDVRFPKSRKSYSDARNDNSVSRPYSYGECIINEHNLDASRIVARKTGLYCGMRVAVR